VGVCVGSGVGLYKPDKKIKPGVTLSWFLNKSCDILPGEYIAVGTWTLQPRGYPDKTIIYTSNPFSVLPAGAQIFISPEQVQKLEGQ
jgi:hypothetical protein